MFGCYCGLAVGEPIVVNGFLRIFVCFLVVSDGDLGLLDNDYRERLGHDDLDGYTVLFALLVVLFRYVVRRALFVLAARKHQTEVVVPFYRRDYLVRYRKEVFVLSV